MNGRGCPWPGFSDVTIRTAQSKCKTTMPGLSAFMFINLYIFIAPYGGVRQRADGSTDAFIPRYYSIRRSSTDAQALTTA